MAGLPGRLSGSSCSPRPGQKPLCGGACGDGRTQGLNVEATSYDEELFAKAASASNQSTALFAVISALVGFLFAFNATLLSVGQRRRLIAELRRDGYEPKTVIRVLAVDGLVLGIGACSVGLVLGEELSIHLFTRKPRVPGQRIRGGHPARRRLAGVAVAVGGGMLAALVAVLSPLRRVLSRDPLAAAATKEGSGGSRGRHGTAGPAARSCLAAATAILLARAEAGDRGDGAAGRGAAALVGGGSSAAARALATARRLTGAVAHIAAMELSAARARRSGLPRPARSRCSEPSRSRAPTRTCLTDSKTRRGTRTPTPTSGCRRQAPTTCCAPRRSIRGGAAEAGTAAGRGGAGLPRRPARLGNAAGVGDRPASGSEATAAGLADRRRHVSRRKGECEKAAGRCSPRRSPKNTT